MAIAINPDVRELDFSDNVKVSKFMQDFSDFRSKKWITYRPVNAPSPSSPFVGGTRQFIINMGTGHIIDTLYSGLWFNLSFINYSDLFTWPLSTTMPKTSAAWIESVTFQHSNVAAHIDERLVDYDAVHALFTPASELNSMKQTYLHSKDMEADPYNTYIASDVYGKNLPLNENVGRLNHSEFMFFIPLYRLSTIFNSGQYFFPSLLRGNGEMTISIRTVPKLLSEIFGGGNSVIHMFDGLSAADLVAEEQNVEWSVHMNSLELVTLNLDNAFLTKEYNAFIASGRKFIRSFKGYNYQFYEVIPGYNRIEIANTHQSISHVVLLFQTDYAMKINGKFASPFDDQLLFLQKTPAAELSTLKTRTASSQYKLTCSTIPKNIDSAERIVGDGQNTVKFNMQPGEPKITTDDDGNFVVPGGDLSKLKADDMYKAPETVTVSQHVRYAQYNVDRLNSAWAVMTKAAKKGLNNIGGAIYGGSVKALDYIRSRIAINPKGVAQPQATTVNINHAITALQQSTRTNLEATRIGAVSTFMNSGMGQSSFMLFGLRNGPEESAAPDDVTLPTYFSHGDITHCIEESVTGDLSNREAFLRKSHAEQSYSNTGNIAEEARKYAGKMTAINAFLEIIKKSYPDTNLANAQVPLKDDVTMSGGDLLSLLQDFCDYNPTRSAHLWASHLHKQYGMELNAKKGLVLTAFLYSVIDNAQIPDGYSEDDKKIIEYTGKILKTNIKSFLNNDTVSYLFNKCELTALQAAVKDDSALKAYFEAAAAAQEASDSSQYAYSLSTFMNARIRQGSGYAGAFNYFVASLIDASTTEETAKKLAETLKTTFDIVEDFFVAHSWRMTNLYVHMQPTEAKQIYDIGLNAISDLQVYRGTGNGETVFSEPINEDKFYHVSREATGGSAEEHPYFKYGSFRKDGTSAIVISLNTFMRDAHHEYWDGFSTNRVADRLYIEFKAGMFGQPNGAQIAPWYFTTNYMGSITKLNCKVFTIYDNIYYIDRNNNLNVSDTLLPLQEGRGPASE